MECCSSTVHPPHSWRKTRIVAFEMPRSCFLQLFRSSCLKLRFPNFSSHDIGVLNSWRVLHTFWPFNKYLSVSFVSAARTLFFWLLTFFFFRLWIKTWSWSCSAKCSASLVLPSRFNTTTAWSVFPLLQWFRINQGRRSENIDRRYDRNARSRNISQSRKVTNIDSSTIVNTFLKETHIFGS